MTQESKMHALFLDVHRYEINMTHQSAGTSTQIIYITKAFSCVCNTLQQKEQVKMDYNVKMLLIISLVWLSRHKISLM